MKSITLCLFGFMIALIASSQSDVGLDGRLDNVRGGACPNDWRLAITGGTTYCCCSGSETNYKDNGGTNGTQNLPCGGGSASCTYPSNQGCGAG